MSIEKYQEMRARGVSPRVAFMAMKADGLDGIAALRTLRQVYGLSLAEAKEASGAGEFWSAQKVIRPGAMVCIPNGSATEGGCIVEARIKEVVQDMAHLDGIKKWRIRSGNLEEEPYTGELSPVPVSRLERPLVEQLDDYKDFLDELYGVSREAV